MNLRRNRRHHYGTSNCDYKAFTTEEMKRPENLTPLEYLSLPKKTTFNHALELRERKTAKPAAPIEMTRTLYSADKKTMKERAQISNPRFHQLEEYELRKRVFTGDSYQVLNENTEINKKLHPNVGKRRQGPSSESCTNIINHHHQADYETKQVSLPGFGGGPDTSKVDLKKVRDVRRAIRRRYIRSKNYKKIFSYWDRDSTGRISPQNVFDMCKKLRLHLTKEECKVLIASSNQSKTGELTPDEFLDLIFNEANVLNLNIEKLDLTTKDIQDSDGICDILHEDALAARNNRHKNQLRLILKNKSKLLLKKFNFEVEQK